MDEIMRTDTGVSPRPDGAPPFSQGGQSLPVDEKRLLEFDKKLREYKAGKASLEKRVINSEQWWKLRNDQQARKEFDIGWDKDFRSVSGWLHNVLVSKHADAMENYPEALVLPREPNDKEQAAMLSSIIPCILESIDFEQTYSDAWWRKLRTGTAVYKCSWDSEALNGLGEISISDVDLLTVFWEPGVRDIQKSRYFFHVELQDNDLLERQYPQLKGHLKGDKQTISRYIYDDNVPTDGKSLVIDVYYKQDGAVEYCKYVGDQVLYSTENEQFGTGSFDSLTLAQDDTSSALRAPAELGASHAARASGSPQGEGMRAVEDAGPYSAPGMGMPQVQHRGLYDDGLYPFVFDPQFPVEGSPCGYGYVDLCKNPQACIDIMRTAFVKNVKAGATPRYFASTGSAVNEEEFLDTTKPIVHVSGPTEDKFIRPIDVAGLPGAYATVYDGMVTELRETSGNTESANGVYSAGVTAASSIAALQEASGKTSRDASRAGYRAFRKLVTMIIERIRQFYTLPRQFRITGQFGQEQFVPFDNSGMVPQPIGLVGTDMGFTQPVFDVKIEAQKKTAYTRTSQNELALQLYQLGVFAPGNEEASLMLLDMMDFDGKQDLQGKLQQRMLLMQAMMAPMGAPAPGGEPVELKDPEANPGNNGVLQKARTQAQGAASV